jgi:hypothetical protein
LRRTFRRGACSLEAVLARPVLAAEGKSQALCESVPNRIFVATTVGSECIAYWTTKGNEQRRQAVFFIDGDLPPVAD